MGAALHRLDQPHGAAAIDFGDSGQLQQQWPIATNGDATWARSLDVPAGTQRRAISASEFERRRGWAMEKQLGEKAREVSRNEPFRGRRKLGDGPPTVGGDRLVLERSPAGATDVRMRHAREEPVLTHVGELFEHRHDQAAPSDFDQFVRREESCLFNDFAPSRLLDCLAWFDTTADRDP